MNAAPPPDREMQKADHLLEHILLNPYISSLQVVPEVYIKFYGRFTVNALVKLHISVPLLLGAVLSLCQLT